MTDKRSNLEESFRKLAEESHNVSLTDAEKAQLEVMNQNFNDLRELEDELGIEY